MHWKKQHHRFVREPPSVSFVHDIRIVADPQLTAAVIPTDEQEFEAIEEETQAQFFLRRRFVLVAKMHNHLPSNYNGTGS